MGANASTALPLTPPPLIRSMNVEEPLLEGDPPSPLVLTRQNAGYWGRFGEPQALNEAEGDEEFPLPPAARPDPEVATRQSLGKRSQDNDGGEEPPLKRRLF